MDGCFNLIFDILNTNRPLINEGTIQTSFEQWRENWFNFLFETGLTEQITERHLEDFSKERFIKTVREQIGNQVDSRPFPEETGLEPLYQQWRNSWHEFLESQGCNTFEDDPDLYVFTRDRWLNEMLSVEMSISQVSNACSSRDFRN